MSVDLQPYKIGTGDQNYPVKYDAALDHMETEINSGLEQIGTNLDTLSAQITSEINTATGSLSTQITGELNAAVGVVEGYRDQALISATKATTQAGIATTKANETVATAALAEGYKDSSFNNALAAAAAAAGIGDVAARVMPILKERGITDIKAIAFKSAEGWEKQGNQSYKSEDRPTGRFLGDYANATAAWGDAELDPAPVEGDVYWQTSGTVGLYKCTTENNSERVYRYGSDHMPLEAMFVASGTGTNARLMIFDLTDPNAPMWKEYISVNSGIFTPSSDASSVVHSGIHWRTGVLSIGISSSGGRGLLDFNYQDDYALRYTDGATQLIKQLSNSTSAVSLKAIGAGFSGGPSSGQVQSIATHGGYVAVATGGGVSVIKPEGSVVNSNSVASFSNVNILNGRLFAGTNNIADYGPIDELGASFGGVSSISNVTTPSLSSGALISQRVGHDSVFGFSANAVDQIWWNPADYQSSLIARRGTNYATPPMKKPELMLICSTVEGAVSDVNNVSLTFDTDLDGFTNASTGTGSVTWNASQYMVVAGADSSNRGIAVRALTTVAGVRYTLEYDIDSAAGSCYIRVGTSSNGTQIGEVLVNSTGRKTYSFVATTTTTFISFNVPGGSFSIDDLDLTTNITDRSGLNNHATIHGNLTATAEVAGGVAGLSGFDSAADYLEAPNSWDGIGTGEGWIAGAFKVSANSVNQGVMELSHWNGSAYEDSRVVVYLTSDSVFAFYVSSNAGSSHVQAITASKYDDSLVHTFVLRKTATAYEIYIDGRLNDDISVGAHGNISFSAASKLHIGISGQGDINAPNSTIWFAGAGQTTLSDVDVNLMHTHMRNLIEGKASLDEIPTSAAYDPIRQAVELVGDTYRQTLQDGAITSSVEHGQGSSATVAVGPRSEVGIGGSSSVEVSVPERNLRDKPLSLVTERKTVTYAGDATGSRALFPDPTNDAEVAEVIGWRPLLVYDDGVEQTKGAADDYTVADYGLGRYCVEFATEPADGNNVDIVFEREVYK